MLFCDPLCQAGRNSNLGMLFLFWKFEPGNVVLGMLFCAQECCFVRCGFVVLRVVDLKGLEVCWTRCCNVYRPGMTLKLDPDPNKRAGLDPLLWVTQRQKKGDDFIVLSSPRKARRSGSLQFVRAF